MFNPIGIPIEKGSNRVIRGGSWNNSATNCRVANRNNNDPSNRNSNNGFRVVLSQLKRRGGCPLLNRLVFPVLATARQIIVKNTELVSKLLDPRYFLKLY